jgi:hypothetical protein
VLEEIRKAQTRMKLDEAPVRANLLTTADQPLVDGVLAGQRRRWPRPSR